MGKKKNSDKNGGVESGFIREQVQPSRRSVAGRFFRRLVLVLIFALVFGVAAGIGLFFTAPRLISTEWVAQVWGVEKETTQEQPEEQEPEPTPEPEPVGTEDTKREEAEPEELSAADANRISRELAAIGTDAQSLLVRIAGKESSRSADVASNADFWSGQVGDYSFGLIYRLDEKACVILTQADAVGKNSSLSVEFADGSVALAQVLGTDDRLNISFLSVDAKDLAKETLETVQAATVSGGVGLVPGSLVIAVGAPDGVDFSVQVGQVTITGVTAAITDGEVELCVTDIPFTAQAGGFVLDLQGRVIGIISTDFTAETGNSGLAFLRVSALTTLFAALQEGENPGVVGMEGMTLDADRAAEVELSPGVYVTEVYAKEPAYEAGMRVADVITAIDGKTVTRMTDIMDNLLEKKAGDTVTYTVVRQSGGGAVEKEIEVVLE